VKLTLNEDVYLWGGREAEVETLAKDAGLTLSTTASRSRGHNVYFTPEPHAVLHLWNHADEKARAALHPLRTEWERSNLNEAPPGFSVPVPEFCELMPFQIAGVHYAKDRANCLIGDAPGLGKTIQAIALANLRGCKRVLVVCPANVRPQWARQIKIWSTLPKVVVYPVFKSSDGVHPTANYVITSFEVARDGLWDTLRSYNWDMLVIDEGHYLKTPDAARTRALFGASKQSKCRYAGSGGISERAEQIVALTGTPLPNRPRECLSSSAGVLTDRGWKYIVDVTLADKLWDGVEWVKHDGLLFQGYAKTVNVAGISATATHRFLAKNTWVRADEASRNTDTLRLLLESGSEALPLEATSLPPSKQSSALGFNAPVDRLNSTRPYNAFALAARRAVGLAAQSMAEIKRWLTTSVSALTTNNGAGYSRSAATPFSGATTKGTSTTGITEAGVFLCTSRGAKTERRFSNISLASNMFLSPADNSTVSTMSAGTSPETFGGLRTKRTCRTDELSGGYRSVSSSWKPVYDIANAGPRRRFTVLSDYGPVIAHNCYTLANALDPSSVDWMNFNSFKDRFNPGGRDMDSGATWEYTARLPELNARLRCNFMVRRLKEDVLKDLPAKRYEIVPVEMTGKIAMALHAEKMLDFDEEEMLRRSGGKIDGAISTVRRQMGEAMAPAVLEHLLTLLDGGVDKLVVFAHHHSVLAVLQAGLAKHGVLRVDGSTSARGKNQAVEKFKFDPRLKVFLGQMQSIATGTDGLQDVATHCVLAEASWVAADNEQAVDRLHRMGQKGSVLAQIMVAPGSISERILGRSISKGRIVQKVLDAQPVQS
jgi:hypothetical protein